MKKKLQLKTKTQVTTNTVVGVFLKVVVAVSLITLGTVMAVIPILKKKDQLASQKSNLITCPAYTVENFGIDLRLDVEGNNGVVENFLGKTGEVRTLLKERNKKDFQRNQLQNLLTERKKYLLQGLYIQPNTLISGIFTKEERNILKKLSAGCIEDTVALTGEVTNMHGHLEEDKGFDHYIFQEPGKQRLSLFSLRGYDQEPRTGQTLSLVALKLENHLFFDGQKLVKDIQKEKLNDLGGMQLVAEPQKTSFFSIPAAQASHNGTTGSKKAAVFLVDFSDLQNDTDVTKSLVETNTAPLLENYYKEVSYEKTTIDTEVFDWDTLPINYSCDIFRVKEETLKFATSKNIPIDDYDYYLIIAPFRECQFVALAGIDYDTSWFNAYSLSQRPGLFPHEVGHNLGVGHASYINCGDVSLKENINDCNRYEYGDSLSVMGSDRLHAHLSAGHKLLLKWMDSSNSLLVTQDGQYTIAPIELTGNGNQSLRIQRGPDDYMYVEFRQPVGMDSDLGSQFGSFDGVLLHVGETGDVWSYLFDPSPQDDWQPFLLQGETFTDPISGIKITVTDVSSSGAQVNVALGARKDFIPPTVSLSSDVAEGSYTKGIVNFSADANDESGIRKVEFYLDGQSEAFFVDQDAPYQARLDAGTLSTGAQVVYAKAYDKANEEGENVQSNTALSEGWYFIAGDRPGEEPPTDQQPPTVAFETPKNNDLVIWGENVPIRVLATDNVGISHVDFYEKSTTQDSIQKFATDDSAPFEVSWDNRHLNISDGQPVSLYAFAYDTSNNYAETRISVYVDNFLPDATIQKLSDEGDGVASNKKPVIVDVNASDNYGIDRVELFVNDTMVATDNTSPYSISWDTSKYAAGTYALKARAYDKVQNKRDSASVNITLDTKLPSVKITEPTNGATVRGTAVKITINASDENALKTVKLLMNGKVVKIFSSPPYEYTWNSTTVKNGDYVLKSEVMDTGENTNTSASVTVQVRNIRPLKK